MSCGAIMPRTEPEGAFVCNLDEGHTGWHAAPLGEDGVANWRDEPAAAAPTPSIDAALRRLEEAMDFCCDQPLNADRMSLTRIWRDILEELAQPGRCTPPRCPTEGCTIIFAHEGMCVTTAPAGAAR
jgi:hypothetical protein